MNPGYSPEVSQNKRDQATFNYEGTAEQSVGKKAKVIETPPSRVIHLRNLPPDCTEQELNQLALPFGLVERILLLKGKNQAFIQMQEFEHATAMVHYYSQAQANIRGRSVYLQYSNRTEITTPQEEEMPANHILLVSVLNLAYPVTIEILHQVFSKYGSIQKIIIFSKKGFQALIQYADRNQAQAAKQALDGQNIYSGCCTLRIQYSTFSNLNVKYNNEKSRDFNDPTLPPGNEAPSSPMAPFGAIGMGLFPETAAWAGAPMGQFHGAPSPFGGYSPKAMGPMGGMGSSMGGIGPTVLIVSNLDPERINPDLLFTLFGVYGDVARVKILYNKPDTALIQFTNPHGAEMALTHLNQCPVHGKTLMVNFSKHTSVSLPREEQEGSHLTKDFSNSPLHRYKVAGSKNFQHICPPNNVLHISNIPVEAMEDDVKNPFSQFGTVTGFKFFMKDKRMALIEFATVSEAVEALMHMHNYQIGNNNIRVSFSKSTL